jgi:hypothetical protein
VAEPFEFGGSVIYKIRYFWSFFVLVAQRGWAGAVMRAHSPEIPSHGLFGCLAKGMSAKRVISAISSLFLDRLADPLPIGDAFALSVR